MRLIDSSGAGALIGAGARGRTRACCFVAAEGLVRGLIGRLGREPQCDVV